VTDNLIAQGTHGPCQRCGRPLGLHVVATRPGSLPGTRQGVLFDGWRCPR